MTTPLNQPADPVIIDRITADLQIRRPQVERTLELLGGGATVPFISRYRKEATGNLDEVQINRIQDLYGTYSELAARKDFIARAISAQDRMTEELARQLDNCATLQELEDLYLPYKPKRKTRAAAAMEKGLGPLAEQLLEGSIAPESAAAAFVGEQVPDLEEALKGARDIIAERINEDAPSRDKLRRLFRDSALLTARVIEGKQEEGSRYRDYFAFDEPIARIPSHRVLAVFRAEMEGVLYASIAPDETAALALLEGQWIPRGHGAAEQLGKAVKDAYKRLLRPSLENEFRAELKRQADEEAIAVFADNLRQLLLAAPLGPQPVIAIDPGYRTGCKTVALDAQGSLLDHAVIFPGERNRQAAAEALLQDWVSRYGTAAIAVGNGTAGRETEAFVRGIHFGRPVAVFMVSESGASVYSASEVAREEFPDHDLTVRGAVSIGRRLMDPLAELVKMDPKSIGVGQYQHDVNQVLLKQSLDRVVISCVNSVGVNLDTASRHLLAYVSGLGRSLAEAIVRYRQENGPFADRQALLKVPGLGEKTFEQCAGFLRIPQGANPLDRTAVHPERYDLVRRMAASLGCEVEALISDPALRKRLSLQDFVDGEVGLPTLRDILAELEKPGRDPRGEAVVFEYAEGISRVEDLKPGMELPGVVTNITNFGVFVDVGVKQDGLVHISELSQRYVRHPGEVVKLHDKVRVTVLEVDVARKRISLSIRQAAGAGEASPRGGRKKEGPRPAAAGPEDFRQKLAALRDRFR